MRLLGVDVPALEASFLGKMFSFFIGSATASKAAFKGLENMTDARADDGSVSSANFLLFDADAPISPGDDNASVDSLKRTAGDWKGKRENQCASPEIA